MPLAGRQVNANGTVYGEGQSLSYANIVRALLPQLPDPRDDVKLHLRLSKSEKEQQPNQTNQCHNGGPADGKTDQICSVRAP
jgi:hypothetical protein